MKKKLSFYNNTLEMSGIHLLYNSLSNGYLVLSDELYQIFKEHQIELEKLELLNKELYLVLEKNGFIVNANFDEVAYVNNLRFQSNFNSKEYSLIVNPSMDCNLKCWYCYENHKKNSTMSLSTADKIINHIKTQHKYINFNKLNLSFFGGEPLLNKKIIIYLVDGIKLFCAENKIEIALSFTTNGTLFNQEILDYLSLFNVSFQITFDGNREKHNATRFFKNSEKGSYDYILKNINRINQQLANSFINIRINFSQETLESIKLLIDEIANVVDKEKVRISLHRIWQVNENKIDRDSIFETLSYIKSKGLKGYFPHLEVGQPCYADTFNHSVINYDGRVFKCTARDFEKDTSEGELLENGMIIWNLEKRLDRHQKGIKTICSDCKLLPACPGICSQSCLEQKTPKCHLENSFFSKSDFIVYNFNKNNQI